jgi:hypothetical protein
MALSGVERLVQYARDLAVEPARAPRRSERADPARPASEPSSDGIKLSLSSAATGTSPTRRAGETALAIPEAKASETTRATATDAVSETTREKATDAVSETTREKATSAAPNASRAENAVAAYQRQGAATLGQRVAIRA